MPSEGGARQGAGRPKGSLSRKHVEILAGAVSEGITPVEYMLAIMRDETREEKDRAWAAEKAAPYIHPRPAPLARSIEIELPDMSTAAGVKAALLAVTNAASTGQVSPAEAQSLAALIEAQRKAIETEELVVRIAALEQSQQFRRRS